MSTAAEAFWIVKVLTATSTEFSDCQLVNIAFLRVIGEIAHMERWMLYFMMTSCNTNLSYQSEVAFRGVGTL